MYKNGKLTEAARAHLEKRYVHQRAKDGILAKIDAKERRAGKKKLKTTNKKLPITKKSNLKTENAKKSAKKVAPVANVSAGEIDMESECPSTPPRNDMVKEREMIMSQNAGVNWITFVDRIQQEAKAEEALYERLDRRSTKDFKKTLEEQITLREAAREKERQAELREQEETRKVFEKFDAEEAKKQEIRHQKVEELKTMRKEQITKLNKARERFWKKELRRDRRAAMKAQAEKDAEEAENLAKKKAHYAQMKEVLKENAKHKLVVLEQQRLDAEENIRLQKMYAKMLDDQEQARKDRLKKTYAQAEEKVANLLDLTAAERQREEEAHRRAEQELLARQAADDERARKKRERLHNDALEIQDYLLECVKAREEKREEDRRDDMEYGRKVSAQIAIGMAKDKAKEDTRHKRLLETSAFIRQQIKDNETRRIQEKADMDENEKAMNMSLIREIESGVLNVKEPKPDPKRPFAWRYGCRSKPF